MQEEQKRERTEDLPNIPEEFTPDADLTQKTLSEGKKTALLRYMAVLFAVAFALVLVSFLIQNHSSNEQITQLSANTSDLISRAEKLQTQNRELEEERNALKAENEELKQRLDTLKNDEPSNQKESSVLKETVETYEALILAMSCKTKEGNLSYSKAMETLKYNQKYLSEPAKELYRALSEENTVE